MGDFTKALLVLLSLTVVACSNKSGGDDGPDRLHQQLEGSVVDAVQDVNAGKFTDACDERQFAQRLEIARALDARAPGIRRLTSGEFEPDLHSEFAMESQTRRVAIAGSYLTETDFVPGEDKWRTINRAWDVFIQRYNLIRNSPTNRNWVILDANVRGLLVDDINRAVNGVDNGLDHTAEQPLRDFQKQIDNCKWLDCRNETISPEIQAVLDRNHQLNSLWKAYLSAKSTSERNEQMELFSSRLTASVRRYGFNTYTRIKREGDELLLPIDAGDFAGYESQVASYIELVWHSQDLKLKIQWIPNPLEPLFKMFMDKSHPNSRAFVNWRNKVVQLYPGTSTRAVAHEFGHVLGFRDIYYTMYDPSTCGYTIELNDGDVMSSHRGGVVTEKEWATLKENY